MNIKFSNSFVIYSITLFKEYFTLQDSLNKVPVPSVISKFWVDLGWSERIFETKGECQIPIRTRRKFSLLNI